MGRIEAKVGSKIFALCVYYSAASVWELAIKHALRPDNVEFTPQELCECCDDAGYEPLDVSREHMLFLTHDSLLPYYSEACIVPV